MTKLAKLAQGIAIAIFAGLPSPLLAQSAQDVAKSDADDPQINIDGSVAPDRSKEPDDGTDPSKTRTQFFSSLEYFDLGNGVNQETLKTQLDVPFARHIGGRVIVPFVGNNINGNGSLALGDIGGKLTYIPIVKRTHAVVTGIEVTFDTAGRPEAGAGQTVIQGTGIYVFFLKGGAIFAPSLQHNQGFNVDTGRSRTSLTTMDFYYVPKLKNPKYFMTIDPSINYDWTNDQAFGALSVTTGRILGEVLGGSLQVFVKPTALVGSNRPGDWAVEGGIKLIGF